MKTKGFTLVELLVVIAILAILATVSVVGYTSFITDANNSVALQELTQIRNAVVAEDITNAKFDLNDADDREVAKATAAVTTASDTTDVIAVNDITVNGGFNLTTYVKTTLGLDGTVAVTDDGKVQYTGAKGGVATWDLATGEVK